MDCRLVHRRSSWAGDDDQCNFHACFASHLVSSAGLAESAGFTHRGQVCKRLGSYPSSSDGSNHSCGHRLGSIRHAFETRMKMWASGPGFHGFDFLPTNGIYGVPSLALSRACPERSRRGGSGCVRVTELQYVMAGVATCPCKERQGEAPGRRDYCTAM